MAFRTSIFPPGHAQHLSWNVPHLGSALSPGSRSTRAPRECGRWRRLLSLPFDGATAVAVTATAALMRRERAARWWDGRTRPRCTLPVRHAADGNAGVGGLRAVFFDCDGVIVVSEELHRVAYNQVFQEFETGVEWSVAYYDVLMNTVGGGKPKMRYHFARNGWPSSKLGPAPTTQEAQEALIDALQARKTEIFEENVSLGQAKPRPGIVDLIDEALSRADLRVAVCSAATKTAAQKVLQSTLGFERLERFDLLLLGDDVSKKKPDPLIYTLAAQRLGVSPADCVVVEDSKIGLDAALGAGMRCYITYSPSTRDQVFAGAEDVVEDATRLSLSDMLAAPCSN